MMRKNDRCVYSANKQKIITIEVIRNQIRSENNDERVLQGISIIKKKSNSGSKIKYNKKITMRVFYSVSKQ
jgi:hypothetical protein